MKVDSGAAVSAIPKHLADLLNLQLLPAGKELFGAGNAKLRAVGKAQVELSYSDRVYIDTVYVIEDLVTPLLGKPALSGLQVITFVGEIVSKQEWTTKFPKLFTGLGSMDTEVKIELREGATPYCQSIPRRVAAARRKPMLEELRRMEKLGVIQKVEGPTEWCAPSIVVPKKNNKIRLCVDFTKLNEAVKRSYHPLPATDELLAQLGGSKVFSKLDANSGYWQMKLSKESQALTTFITPFGRYLCCRLPFGISIAPEIFSREMQRILEGIEGIVCQMDDILIHSEDEVSHKAKIEEGLNRLCSAGVTLNVEKCEFFQSRITFLGHVVDAQGIHADPEKIRAIQEFPPPRKVKDLKRFFGMVNYLGKFSPSLASDSVQLRQLLKKENKDNWTWNDDMALEYEKMKQNLASAPVLSPFSLEADTLLSTDASSYRLGAALFQKTKEGLKPIAFASRALSETEQRYAQIEKEALAICWAAEKFYYYLAGRKFQVETDHKPLISILSKMELAKLPMRVQRFRLRMMKFCYSIRYTPGEKLLIADALSRAPCPKRDAGEIDELDISEMIEDLPMSETRRRQLQFSTLNDAVCQQIKRYIQYGWPEYKECPQFVKNFYTFKESLTEAGELLFYNNRSFIPLLERQQVLKDIHTGHLGESKCLERAKDLVWWPGLTTEVRDLVKTCATCLKHRSQPREPLISVPFPERPWWQIGMDLCTVEERGNDYLIIMDYFSRYLIAEKLTDTTAETVCRTVKKVFSLFGIPNSVISDNGPQFVSDRFKQLMDQWNILHRTSSPKYSQSNGEAERGVQTFKKLIKKNENVDQALLCYRDAPLQNGYSPAQLLMGRGLNSMGILAEKQIDLKGLKDFEARYRNKQADQYNRRHRVKIRTEVQVGDRVTLKDPGVKPCPSTVVAVSGREVALQKENGQILRRNRQQISPDIQPTAQQSPESTESDVPHQKVSPPVLPDVTHQVLSQANPVVKQEALCPQPDSTGTSFCETVPVSSTNRIEGMPSLDRMQVQPETTRTTRSGRSVKPVKRMNL